MAAAAEAKPEKAARDAAIIGLCFSLGLRRGEIASLDLDHVNLRTGHLSILGKGRSEREPLSMPQQVCDALRAWLRFRGPGAPDAPLFTSLDNASRGGRLSGWSIWDIVRTHGDAAGIVTRPHGLRHSAITAALDAFGGDFRLVRGFSRHATLDTVRRYDDNRADHHGRVAAALGAIIG